MRDICKSRRRGRRLERGRECLSYDKDVMPIIEIDDIRDFLGI